jgi:hypothetical protein
MTKFIAQSINYYRTAQANEGRKARKAKCIVNVEADDGSWFELDADDMEHAHVLARNMVDVQSARGASCWQVNADGVCKRRSFFNYYNNGGADWD